MTQALGHQIESFDRAWRGISFGSIPGSEASSNLEIVHCALPDLVDSSGIDLCQLEEAITRVSSRSLFIVSIAEQSKILQSRVTEFLSVAFSHESLIFVRGKTCFWLVKTERDFVRRSQNSSERARIIELDMESALETVTVWSSRKMGIRPPILPKVLILGVQKCGTTALFDMLTQHPKLAGGESGGQIVKEIGYFNRYYDSGPDWYQSYFRRANMYYVDATVDYSATRQFLERIREDLPSAKFLYIMRDPVERVYSAWNFWHRLPASTKQRWELPVPGGTFEENLKQGMENENDPDTFWGFVARGYYDRQIDVLKQLFDTQQLHLCFNESLRADPQGQLNAIFDFIGVDRHTIQSRERNSSAYRVEPMSEETESWLEEVYEITVRNLREKHGLSVPWMRW